MMLLCSTRNKSQLSWQANVSSAVSIALLTLCLVCVSCQEELVDNVRYVRADELRDHGGQCFDASRCALRDVGEEWTVHSDCEKATCLATNGTLMEKRTRCADVGPITSEDCYIVRVEGRPYPKCCPKLFCNNKLVTPDLSNNKPDLIK